jgi:peptidylprolyl isomerase
MPRSRVLSLVTVLVLACAALAASGCGSSSKDDTGTSSTPTSSTSQTTAPVPDLSVPKVSNPTDLEHKPKIAKPSGSPPPTLVSEDLVTGNGRAAASGDTVTVQYVGISFSNGKQFDASWGKGQPLTFPLGQGQVIQGWDQGVVGMKVGGRRELVIPPDLGYGATGQGGILPNETLVFVVDLKKIA